MVLDRRVAIGGGVSSPKWRRRIAGVLLRNGLLTREKVETRQLDFMNGDSRERKKKKQANFFRAG